MFPRDRQPELMDAPELPAGDHRQALAGLARLNRISGVSPAIFSRIVRFAQKSPERPLKLLDVASGSGDLPVAWAVKARRMGLKIQITTTDVSEVAIERQREQAHAAGVQLGTLKRDCVANGLPDGFDLVVCSLFMHHLDDAQTGRLLQAMQASAQQALIVCDLERSWMNLALVKLASRLVSRSYVVHHDAAASIRGAYTCNEFAGIARRALARPIKVQRLFPCRFLTVVEECSVPVTAPAFA